MIKEIFTFALETTEVANLIEISSSSTVKVEERCIFNTLTFIVVLAWRSS